MALHVSCYFMVVLSICQLRYTISIEDGITCGVLQAAPSLLHLDEYDLVEKFEQDMKPDEYGEPIRPDLFCDKIINVSAFNFIVYTSAAKEGFQFTIDTVETLKESTFNFQDDTKFVAHGWYQDGVSFAAPFVEAYFKESRTLNIVSVDWSHYTKCEYVHTVHKIIPAVGHTIALVIKKMISYGSSLGSFHLIGHSFGSHVVAYAGQSMRPHKLNRITGTDPAGPFFYTVPVDKRLSKDDAHFVDIIHTNAGGMGILKLVGHVDYFVNGGTIQPHCPPMKLVCYHQISNEYYIESINSPKAFCAMECKSYKDYDSDICTDGPISYMGEHVNNGTRGMFFLDTKKVSPYGLGCRY